MGGAFTFLGDPFKRIHDATRGDPKRMKLSNRVLVAAAICCALCALLSVVGIDADQFAFSRNDPSNRLGLSQDTYHAVAGWAFLLYDLLHIFVIVVFALVLAQTFSWEAWMGGGTCVVSSLAALSSLSVNMFFLMAALRAMADGRASGLVTPEAGYDVICSTLDFAQASFGLVGTLFLATAAIKASGMARLAGRFLLLGLPISFFQLAEIGVHTPWTTVVDSWVIPINAIIQQIVIGLALCAILRRRLRSPGLLKAGRPTSTWSGQHASQGSRPTFVVGG
jgi:hypothetical protein